MGFPAEKKSAVVLSATEIEVQYNSSKGDGKTYHNVINPQE